MDTVERGPGEAAVGTTPADHVAVYSYADGFGTFEEIEDATVFGDDEGWLFGPFLELKIQEVGVVDEFDPPTGPPYRAADGHELVVTYFSEASHFSAHSTLTERDPQVEGIVHAGDQATSLESELHLPARALVVSVPTGQAPRLEVVAEGRSQTVDLLTAEIVDSSHGPYALASQQLSYRYSGDGRVAVNRFGLEPSVEDETVELEIEWLARTPWLPTAGYASDGMAWLVAGPNAVPIGTEGGGIIGPGNDMFFHLRASEAFILEDETGTEIPAERFLIGQPLSGPGILVFEVPDTFTTGTLHVDVGAGTAWLNPGFTEAPTSLQWEQEWESPPPADDVEIDLVEQTAAPPGVYDTETPYNHYVYD